ncbi:MAG: lipid II:glycine glycyltransferase FemX [Undibacterium sp.]
MSSRSFLTTHAPDGGLLQSDEWAKLQIASGHEAMSFQGSGFEGIAFQHTLPVIGKYLFIPRGPVANTASLDAESLKSEFIRMAESSRAHWLRIEPQTEACLQSLKQVFGANEIVPAPRDINPRETFMVSLTGTIEEWFGRMKSKTRYNVRLAEKHGVSIRFSRTPEDVESFTDLIYATTNRKAIAPHPKAYYRNFIAVLPEEMCTIALAEHEGQVIAASLLVFFNGTASYLHGGSADTKRELMAPFLLHLKAMEEAKRRGCARYDFGGVRIRSKQGDETSWDGITRFKQGFDSNAETLLFPGTYDIILSPFRYSLYRQFRQLIRLRTKVWNFFR